MEIYKSAIDIVYAYSPATLDDETTKLTGFSSVDKLFDSIRKFYGLQRLRKFFTPQMSLFSRRIFGQESTRVYIDDILLMTNAKPHLLQLIKHFNDIATKIWKELLKNPSTYISL